MTAVTETPPEVEPTAVHAPGAELTQYMGQPLEEYRPRLVMAPDEAAALDDQLRSMMRAILKENVDYGIIPGASKASLWKPGAEKLLQWFGFGHELEEFKTERNPDGTRLGVTYRCIVTKEMSDGRKVIVSTCDGYTGYDESTFYTSEADARAKAEADERKWAAKDKREVNPARWQGASEYRAPWNSLVKMAIKRALVGAALQATSASTLFTQDMEDLGGGPDRFAGAADAALRALPLEVRDALDSWWKAKKWPPPDRWTPQQLVSALLTAGYLAARREPAQPAGPARPAEGDAKTTEDAWVTGFRRRLAKADGDAALGALGNEVNHAMADGVIRQGTASGLHADISARRRQPQEAARPAAGQADMGPGEADWVIAFRRRLSDVTDEEGIRRRRGEIIAARRDMAIAADTANALLEDVKLRGTEIRKPAAA